MAKLSLWLLTLGKDKPFTFLDHAIRCGDSLVGISSDEQLKTFSLDRQGLGISLPNFLNMIPKVMEATRLLRVRLEKIADDTISNVEEKQRLFDNIRSQTKRLNYAADRLLAASWKFVKPAERVVLLRAALQEVDDRIRDVPPDTLEAEGLAHREEAGCPRPFHWPLEFPEVFLGRGGFDAFVGNPPFLPGPQISVLFGDGYRDWVKLSAPHAHGNSDLVCYFLLRAFMLLHRGGGFGLLATKSIREGDSRKASLNWLVNHEGQIHFVLKSVKWPGVANVSVAAVCVRRGDWQGERQLDGRPVVSINDFLEEDVVQTSPPEPLAACAGKAFRGSILSGNGFVLSEAEVQSFIDVEPQSREVIFPVIGGEDLNSRFGLEPNRYAINVCTLSEAECRSRYPAIFSHLERTVRVERETNDASSNTREFWRYWSDRPKLQEWMRRHPRVLAISQATKHICFAFIPTQYILVNTLNLFTIDDNFSFGVIQSSTHTNWALSYATSLESGTLRYTYTTCFETFPFPHDRDRATLSLRSREYQEFRSNLARGRRSRPIVASWVRSQ